MAVTWSDCTHCNGPLPPGSLACPACGAAAGDDVSTATALRGEAGRANPTLANPLPPRASDQDTPPDGLRPPEAAGELGRLGGYRVLGRLGAGGMGAVYRAEDPQLRRLVALKVMLPKLAADPTAKDRFLREARAAAAVEHDHIVPIHQVGEDQGTAFLTMPLLKGQSLASRLQRERPLPVAEALRIGREVALGLAAAHDRALIHRDIKPANIWLEGSARRVRILDFGLARSASPDAGEWLTDPGSIVGTPVYMSPEQARNDPLDGRSDLFSLGTVLYEMTTGRVPFRGKTTTAVLTALAVDEPRPPMAANVAVPAGVSDFILRLLSKDPADRPATAAAVARELGRLLTAATVTPLDGPAADVWGRIDDDAPTELSRTAQSGRLRPKSRAPLWVSLGAAVLVGAVALAAAVIPRRPAKEGLILDHNPGAQIVIKRHPPEVKPKQAGPADDVPEFGLQAGGLMFDGKTTRVTIPTSHFDGNLPLTVEAWVTPARFGQEGHICLLGNPGGGIGFSTDGAFGAGLYDGSKWHSAYGSKVPAGKRVHLAAVFTADGIALYIDGKNSTTKVEKLGRLPPTRPPAVLGAHVPDAAPGHFHGTMHAVRVSKAARYIADFKPADRWEPDAATTLQYQLEGGTGDRISDLSPNGHQGTVENGTWVKGK